jgi:hypothetical protein
MSLNASYSISTTFAAAGSAATGPYLLPPSFVNTPTQALVLWITCVCAGTTTSSTPGISSSAQQPDFTLAFSGSPMGGLGMFAKVTVQPSNLYSDNRAPLQASFLLFKQQIEQLEAGGALIPGGTDSVIEQVAANLPLRFDEVLTYHYGYDPLRQCVDLQAGLSLRVDWGGYQYCDAPGGPGYSLNAYVGYGSSRFLLSRLSNGKLAFDTFSGGFQPGYGLNPAATCPQLLGGPVDLQVAGNARRRWRLVYPATINGAGSVDNQTGNGQNGCILLGADTYADLEAATAAVLNGNSGCGTASGGNNPVVVLNFTGRTTAVAEITLLLRNQLTNLALGSSFRNVIQQSCCAAPTQFLDASGQLTQVSSALWRWVQASGVPLASNSNTFGQAPVSFTATPVTGPYGDEWDLPLLKGDSVWWQEPSAPTS